MTIHRFLVVTLILSTGLSVLAAEQESAESATTAADQLRALNDPTIVRSNVWLDTEWDQYKHGAREATWTFGGLWGWRVSDEQDWVLRGKLPIVYDRSDQASGNAEVGGLGDIELATGTALRLNKAWRTGGGIELHADTASEPALGDSVWRLHSSWSVAHDIYDWLSVTSTVEYNHSISEENNVAEQRYLELSLPCTFVLPSDWSIATSYKAKVDFVNDDHWTHTVDLGLAKRLPHSPIVLSATFEKQFDGGNKRFELNFTTTYYFGK